MKIRIIIIFLCSRNDNIQIGNRISMSAKCSKCCQLKQNSHILTCGHSLCSKCLPQTNYSHQFIVSCPSCSIMTIIQTSLPPVDTNPDNYIVCLQCKSDVMTTRGFLESPHRRHDVTSVANIVHDVQKSLRKYQLSFDLQSQALYTQAESLSKQKRMICEQYSKNSHQIQALFSQLKTSIEMSQAECTKEYQKLVLEVIQSYDQKIKEIKSEIFKCESFMQCIDHSLIKSNASKYVAATQFYFLNYAKLEESLTELIEIRKDSLNQIGGKGRIKSPNLKPIHELIISIKNISEKVWNYEEKRKEGMDMKKNPQSQAQSYFQLKRKQVFDINGNNSNPSSQSQLTTEPKIFNFMGKQKQVKVQNSQASRVTETNQSYNIDGRIQNLRKTLKLGQKSNLNNSKSYTRLSSGYKAF